MMRTMMRVFRPTARWMLAIGCSRRSENLYDKLGRVYRTKTYAVDPDDGTVGSALVSDTWLDAAGRTIKQQSGGSDAFSKMVYDGLGRVTKQYVGLRHGRNGLRRCG